MCDLLQIRLPVDHISANLRCLGSDDVRGDGGVHGSADVHPQLLDALFFVETEYEVDTTWMEMPRQHI